MLQWNEERRQVTVLGRNKYIGTRPYWTDRSQLPEGTEVLYFWQIDRIQKGSYVQDSEGTIVEVMDVQTWDCQKSKKKTTVLVTPFGFMRIATCGSLAKTVYFKRHRQYFTTITTKTRPATKDRVLTQRDKKLIMALVHTGEELSAWELVSGLKVTTIKRKHEARYAVRRALKTPEGYAMYKDLISEKLRSLGISPEEWIEKMASSVVEKIKTKIDLDIWMTLGKMIPEVRDHLLGEGGEGGDGRIPIGATRPALYEDICPVCEGTKMVEVVIPSTGMLDKIVCPACKPKLEPLSLKLKGGKNAVQERKAEELHEASSSQSVQKVEEEVRNENNKEG